MKNIDNKAVVLGICGEDSSPLGKKIKLTQEKESLIIRDIEAWIGDVESLRKEDFIEKKWEDADDDQDGIMPYKDFPFELCSNFNIGLVKQKKKVLLTKTNQVVFTNPLVLCKPRPKDSGNKDIEKKLQNKEKWLNATLIKRVKIEEPLMMAYDDMYVKGTGFVKGYWDTRVEPRDEIELWSSEQIEEFIEEYGEQQGDAYLKALGKLQSGESVKIFTNKIKIVWDRARVSYVPIKQLYVKPNITELEENRIVPEIILLGYHDIEEGVREGKYDKEVLEELKEKYGENDEYLDRVYEAVEARYKYDYDGKGARWTIMTYLRVEDRMIESKTYVYAHGMLDYIDYSYEKRKDSIYGDGLWWELRHVIKALNDFWNTSADTALWKNAPSFAAVGDPQNPDKVIQKFGPAMIWWVKKAENVKHFPIHASSAENFKFIEMLMREGSLTTQVSDYASGGESKIDPNAPASKTLALLQETNSHIGRVIRSVHRKNEQLFEMIDKLYQQFYEFSTEDKIEKMTIDGKTFEISEEDLFTPCEYEANNSPLTINKALQHDIDTSTMATMLKIWGSILGKDPKKMNRLGQLFLRGAQGEWPNYIDEFFPEEGEGMGTPKEPMDEITKRLKSPEIQETGVEGLPEEMTPEGGNAR